MNPRNDGGRGLPLRGQPRAQPPRTHDRIIIAHHIVITGYGHWLPNDLRGSGSTEIRKDELEDLGPILPGRQPIQPSRDELRAFLNGAEPLLEHSVFWFRTAKRQALADAFARAVADLGYTVWACAICSNHVHLCVRRHRDSGEAIRDAFAGYGRDALRAFDDVGIEHPVWADRPYIVYLFTPDEVRGRIGYINTNPLKERLPAQYHPFVVPYDGWPHPKH